MGDKFNREVHDKNLHLKNLLIHYSKFVDKDRLKSSPKEYGKYLDKLKSEIFLDFKKNILFIGKGINKFDVFLACLLKYDKLKTYYSCDISTLTDIALGQMGIDNINVKPEDSKQTVNNINEDILLIYGNRFSSSFKNISIINNVAINRIDLDKHKRTWVYFDGTVDEMRRQEWSNLVYELFSNDERFDIIDLNSNSKIVGKNKNHKAVDLSNTNSNLLDVY